MSGSFGPRVAGVVSEGSFPCVFHTWDVSIEVCRVL